MEPEAGTNFFCPPLSFDLILTFLERSRRVVSREYRDSDGDDGARTFEKSVFDQNREKRQKLTKIHQNKPKVTNVDGKSPNASTLTTSGVFRDPWSTVLVV